jgi:hypothetical protein
MKNVLETLVIIITELSKTKKGVGGKRRKGKRRKRKI